MLRERIDKTEGNYVLSKFDEAGNNKMSVSLTVIRKVWGEEAFNRSLEMAAKAQKTPMTIAEIQEIIERDGHFGWEV